MASEALNDLASQYRLISDQLERAAEQEFNAWSVIKNSSTGKYGLFISIGVIKNWCHVRVFGNVNEEWKITETSVCNNQDLWPDWIKKSKGLTIGS